MSKFEHNQLLIAGEVLCDQSKPLKERFRALFSLKDAAKIDSENGNLIISLMFKGLDKKEPSALLKHEIAYCLGQTECPQAVALLETVLLDTSRETIVRHEAGEALGAIANRNCLPLLSRLAKEDPIPEVRDTCELAVDRINWLHGGQAEKEKLYLSNNPYNSVDPAPPAVEKDTSKLLQILLDEKLSLFERYRAMFALRNIGDKESIQSIAQGNDNVIFLTYETTSSLLLGMNTLV